MDSSEVWKHFKKDVKEAKAICSICSRKLSCKGSTTSSLIRHLESTHKINLKRKHIPASTKKPAAETSEVISVAKKIKMEPQESIDMFVKKKSMAEIVAKLVALDGFSVFAISKSSFIRESFSKRGYSLPKNHSDIMQFVHDYYRVIKQRLVDNIKIKIQENKKFSITLEEWTSKRNRRYVNVNIHESSGECHNLGLFRIFGIFPAEKAAQLLEAKLNNFGLGFNDIIGCTTDGSAVMVKFGKHLPIYHQMCYNHGIHLAVMDVLYTKSDQTIDECSNSECETNSNTDTESDSDSEIYSNQNIPHIRFDYKEPLNRIRKIVRLFKLSPVRNKVLQTYVKVEHGKELNLLLDSKTRWNTICTMIERFLLIKNSVKKALTNLKLETLFVENDLIEVGNLLNIIKPIELAIEALNRRDSNLLTSEGVLNFLFVTLESQESAIAKEISIALKDRINQRRNNNIVSLIKFLQNPQSLRTSGGSNNFLKMSSKNDIVKIAKEYAAKIFVSRAVSSDSENLSDDENEAAAPLKNETFSCGDTLPELLKSNIEKTLQTMPVDKNLSNRSIGKEMNIYENTGVIPSNLKHLLDCLKSIQPTSTESKHVYSLAGNLITIKRESLSDQSINAICFMKNYFLKTN